jgi:radical SAM protein with 4Fe4S-binding SPASM domain
MYKGKFCTRPFESLIVDEDGDVMLCGCQAHMPFVIGNIYKNSLKEIWNNELAQQVRQSVIDQDFTYCSWSCNWLPRLPQRPISLPIMPDFPKIINLSMDRSCNLKCPSCRESTIMEKNSDKISVQIALFDEIKQWAIDHPDRTIIINPISSGEIFASHSGLNFLKSLIDYPNNNLRLDITTNGTLLYKNKDLLRNIASLINEFQVSIDAATADTFAQIRGGDWNNLIEGLDFVRDELKLKPCFRFCVQKNNWHEIEKFVDFSLNYNAFINFQKLNDWGHWDIQWWHENNVFDRNKSSFNECLSKLAQIKKDHHDKVFLAVELHNYLNKAM